MDPITASAAITAGTSIINGLMGSTAAKKEYKYARKLQKYDQAFQKEMRATAYQTTVADMQKAGINPAVALSGGASQSQAGSGSSQSAPDVNYGQIDPISAIQTMVSAKNQTALTNADVANKNAETIKILTEAGYNEEKIRTATHERNLIVQQIKNAKTQNEKDKAEKEIAEWNARHPILSRILPATAGASGAVLGAIAAGPVGAGIGYGIGHGFRKPNPIGFNR